MNLFTPELLSITAIIVSVCMGIGGFLTTLFTSVIGFMIKNTMKNIDHKIDTIDDKVEALEDSLKSVIEKKDQEHDKLHRRITKTEETHHELEKAMALDLRKIIAGQASIKGVIENKVILSTHDTKK